MKVIRAEAMGMCFGVRDALQITNQVSDPSRVTIHGELVHNPRVTEQLQQAGFKQSTESNRQCDGSTPIVLITAHGISNAERGRLGRQDKQLIDTTCPLVRRVHEAAIELAGERRHIVLIGKEGHVEVRGIVDDLDSYDVVSVPDSVRTYGHANLGVICQTTMPVELVDQVHARIRELNSTSDIRFVDTVCRPTKQRQQAMQDLIHKVDAVVVVGGMNSNNTRRLVELCTQHGKPALHVTCADGVDGEWVSEYETIGLTAGTSTLDETIDQVEQRIMSWAKTPISTQ